MKYYNKNVVIDGIKFQSKLEGQRYRELKVLEKAGYIKDLVLQPHYELQPAYEKNGKRVRKIEYIADFSYFDIEKNKVIVEDTKGFKTEVYKLKHKMFEYKYPELEIEEITRY